MANELMAMTSHHMIRYYQTWNKTTPDFSVYREQYNLMIPSVEQPNNINVQQMFSNVQNINDLINMLPIPNTGALQPIKDILNALEDLGIFQALDFASEMFSALTQVIGNAVTAAEYGQFLDVSTHQYNLFQLFEANETAINDAMENASRWNPNTPLGYNGVDISVATTANGNYLQSNGIVQYHFGTLPWDPLDFTQSQNTTQSFVAQIIDWNLMFYTSEYLINYNVGYNENGIATMVSFLDFIATVVGGL